MSASMLPLKSLNNISLQRRPDGYRLALGNYYHDMTAADVAVLRATIEEWCAHDEKMKRLIEKDAL